MRHSEMQDRIEARVYEAIEELGEEFDMDITSYPSVYWIGRAINFKDLYLDENYKPDFLEIKKDGSSIYLRKPKIVIITRKDNEHINEESSHFFHLFNSGISLNKKSPADWSSLKIIIELFGFLGSKILDASRKNPYIKYEDLLLIGEDKKLKVEELLKRVYGLSSPTYQEFYLHQQGYGLGERMFYDLIKGRTTKKELKKLLLKDFSEPNSATLTFFELRRKFWPVVYSK